MNGYGGIGGKGMGKYKITLENLPDDMTWAELKELGKQYSLLIYEDSH